MCRSKKLNNFTLKSLENMKITVLFIMIVVIFIIPVYSKKLGALPELEKPNEMLVNNGQLIISDKKIKVHLYSLKDLKYLKQITRKGEGPGECRFIPLFWVGQDYIYLFNPGKCMFFSRNGEYKKEFRIPEKNISLIAPFGKDYVVQRHGKNPRKNMYTSEISVESYSKEKGLQYKKLIFYNEYPPREKKGGKIANPYPREFFGFIIFNEKVLVADSKWGLFAEIYNYDGNRISQINLDIEKTKVTEKFKADFWEIVKQSNQWAQVKEFYYIDFPEYFPAIYKVEVDKGKIYFVTYKQNQNKREIIITDWQGNLLKRTYVPWGENTILKYFSIENDKFYYLDQNEDTEDWELHMEEIK